MAQVNSGKSNKQVVQNLINDMRSFNEIVNGQLQTMMESCESLGDSWKDSQYSQFHTFISELVDLLKKDLITLDEATNALQTKVNMY